MLLINYVAIFLIKTLKNNIVPANLTKHFDIRWFLIFVLYDTMGWLASFTIVRISIMSRYRRLVGYHWWKGPVAGGYQGRNHYREVPKGLCPL